MSKADKNICTRKTCTFYGSVQNGTCNYRQKTGVGRGCPITECDKFTTEPYERTNSGMYNPNRSIRNEGVKKDMNQKYNWETILREFDDGAEASALSEKYGFGRTLLYKKLRERYEADGIPFRGMRRKKEGRSFYDPIAKEAHMTQKPVQRAVNASDPAPEQTPAAEETTPPCANVGAERPSKDPRTGISNFRWYSDDLKCIADILETLSETNSLQRYRDCSKYAQSIIADMCEERIRKVGALERWQKEKSNVC